MPSKSPLDLDAFNVSSTSIKLLWQPIPDAYIHGTLLGYHVHLRKLNETELEKKFTVSPNRLSFKIGRLLKYTKYVVQILGFTSVGVGVISPNVTVSTDEDSKS